MTFIETFEENVRKYPDNPAVRSYGQRSGRLTYSKLNRRAGMVYQYLKDHGIGKEDFVMICLPRSIRTVICMLGVWKAGAAFVIVEDAYAPDRIDFIYKDCGCKLKIDLNVLADMMDCEPLYGHEETDDHDAAYAVYTSGSTGTPKGVLHEYGNLTEAVESNNFGGVSPEDVFAYIPPMNFVAMEMFLLRCLSRGAAFFIVPYSISKNIENLKEMLVKEKITSIFMPASLARLYDNWSPYLKTIMTGSEPVDGLYVDGPDLYNLYGMSETGFFAGVCTLDKPYNPAPIGKPQFEKKLCLAGSDGVPDENLEEGELCIENDYVRGYLNLPGKTAETFADHWLHTGDMARVDNDGNYFIVGRTDDMVKINGNRIEPGEIEHACKKVLGLPAVMAKGFVDEKRGYVCLYFLNEDAEKAGILAEKGRLSLSESEIRSMLESRLPYYMIPTYYVGLDEFPKNANGKLYRKGLQAPLAADFSSDYAEPVNNLQRTLCKAFESALERQKIGIHDDFYLLGGDSIAAISVIAVCDLPGLSVNDLYVGRTPEKIAAIYENKMVDTGDPEEDNRQAMLSEKILMSEQIMVMDIQLEQPKSVMWNLPYLFELKADVDICRFRDAVDRAIRNHPALLTEFYFNYDSELVQHYNEDLFVPTKITAISYDELMAGKEKLEKYFRLLNSRMYRTEIFETEKGNFFFLDIHHSVIDGTGFGILYNDIFRCYEDVAAVLNTDYYYLQLKEYEQLRLSDAYKDAEKYYLENVEPVMTQEGAHHYFGNSTEIPKFEFGCMRIVTDIRKEKTENSPLFRKYGGHVFFIMALLLTEAKYNSVCDASAYYIFKGRDDSFKINTLGLLFKISVVHIIFKPETLLDDLFAKLKADVDYNAAHCFYPYADISEFDINMRAPCMIYQKNTYSLGKFSELVAEWIEIVSDSEASDTVFDIELIDTDGKDVYTILSDYSSDYYDDDTMSDIISEFCKTIVFLADADENTDCMQFISAPRIDESSGLL